MPISNQNEVIVGQIIQNLPNTMFKIQLSDGREILATPSGRMRRGFMKLLPGEMVRVEFTPYDRDRGRIVGKG